VWARALIDYRRGCDPDFRGKVTAVSRVGGHFTTAQHRRLPVARPRVGIKSIETVVFGRDNEQVVRPLELPAGIDLRAGYVKGLGVNLPIDGKIPDESKRTEVDVDRS
jgi:hypothetical protein